MPHTHECLKVIRAHASVRGLLRSNQCTLLQQTQQTLKQLVCALDAVLQCSNREGLHNLPCWLSLNNHDLAKHFPLPSLGGRLHACLDPTKPWNGENTVALHLLCCNCCQCLQNTCSLRLLHLALLPDFVRECPLRHSPTGGFLHGSHGW